MDKDHYTYDRELAPFPLGKKDTCTLLQDLRKQVKDDDLSQ